MTADLRQGMLGNKWTHRWAWKRPEGHKGLLCRVLASGKLNSVLVLWENGHMAVTSRRGLRRVC